jgi:hypothetical protein
VPPCEAHQQTIGLLACDRLTLNLVAKAESKGLVMALVLAGVGISFLPDGLVEDEAGLCTLPVSGPGCSAHRPLLPRPPDPESGAARTDRNWRARSFLITFQLTICRMCRQQTLFRNPMKRILVIFSHPALQSSRANKQLLHAIEGLEGSPCTISASAIRTCSST